MDDLDGGGFFGGLLATTFGWFALLQYLAVYRRHAAAAGVIGAALGCFGALAGIVTGFIIADETLGTSIDPREFFRLTCAVIVATLLACSSYLNLKWQAKVLEAEKSDQPSRVDWQFSFRELILGITVLATVLGVAMWQARGRQ
ncbi:hypothetical protein NA78x_001900 [Anatilimnocola sp. NA78]|uniref:hypothetical protein n=1 Tax=Anatilimnocola sp. NA78 TaxID=3415683 RepID=UPI003CE49073